MSTETRPTSSAEAPALPAKATAAAPAAAPVTEPTPVPECWKPLFRELTTYYRHLPQLLAEGEAGRYVVVKGDQLYNTWETYGDASQYGRERFGDELFMIHQVDPREVERLARFFPPREAPCPG
jgi:hypothetical protein